MLKDASSGAPRGRGRGRRAKRAAAAAVNGAGACNLWLGRDRLRVAMVQELYMGGAVLAEAGERRDVDPRRLAETYAARGPAIRRFLRGLLGERAAADDATQETFARAFTRLANVEDPARLTPWLFGIARHVALEMRRERRRTVDLGEHEAPEPAHHDTPERALLGREAVGVIDCALARLSTDRRAVLLLRLDHGVSYDDIAALMDWSLAKTKVEIHRARAVLREELARYEEEGDRDGR